MKPTLTKVLLAAAVSPAYIAAHHLTPSPNVRDDMVSTAAQAQCTYTIGSRNSGDTTKGADTAQERPARPAIGSAAPQLKIAHWIHDPKWGPVKFGDGHVYVLDFTALWCGSCPATYPIMTDVLKKYGPQGVRVIFVTTQYGIGEDHMSQLSAQEELAAYPEYFSRHNVTEPVAVYSNFKDLTRDYSDDGQSMKLPKMVVIDGHGVVQEAMTGWEADKAHEQVLAVVAKLVQPPKP